MTVDAAMRQPVEFQGRAYIRVGEHTKNLRDRPGLARDLWARLIGTPFESGAAMANVALDQILDVLDIDAYFTMMRLTRPASSESVAATLAADGLVARDLAGGWTITNVGAILFAKRLSDFPGQRARQ